VGLAVSWWLAPETNARSLADAASLDDTPSQKASMPGPMAKRHLL
jgi:putative MFS transporter